MNIVIALMALVYTGIAVLGVIVIPVILISVFAMGARPEHPLAGGPTPHFTP